MRDRTDRPQSPFISIVARTIPLGTILAAAIPLLALSSCGLFDLGGGGGGGGNGAIPSSYWGSWVRLDKEQYLYFGDEKIYARASLYESWSELIKRSASAAEITASDNGIVSGGFTGTLVTVRPDLTKPGWLKVTSSGGTAYYRKAGAKTASFTGTLNKDETLLSGKGGASRALMPAGGISLIIVNALNSAEKYSATTNTGTGEFAVDGVIPGDSFTVTPEGGSPVVVTVHERDEDVGVVSVPPPNKPYNFKAEYDYSATPVDFGLFSAKFMVAAYQYQKLGLDGNGNPYPPEDYYYDVSLRIRNTGTQSVSNFSYALAPSDGLDLRADSAPLGGNVTGSLGPGEAHALVLHLRRPAAVDESIDVETESIGVTVTDAEGYVWQDRVQFRFWRKLIYIEVFRLHKGPLIGDIASPENDASGAWLNPAGDAVEWYYLPYRREGYTIGIYPVSATQGQTKYAVGFEKSVLADVGLFDSMTTDGNEGNNAPTAATPLSMGQFILGIIGPGDVDYFKTKAETAPDPGDTTAPDPITDFAATVSDRSITLSWTEPGDEDYREVEISGQPGDLWRSPDKGTTSWTFGSGDGVTNGTAYSFSAVTVDWSGNRSDAVSLNNVMPAWDKAGATSYTLNGSFGSVFSDPPDGRFKEPCDIALTGEGDYVVADTGNNRIQLINPDGTWLYSWGRADGAAGGALGEFDAPAAVAVVGATLYVADTGNNRIQVFDLGTKARTGGWGGAGTATGQFSSTAWKEGPNALTTDGNYLYVSDAGNNRVQVFTPDGTFQKAWSGFNQPLGLAVYGENLFIANYGTNTVLTWKYAAAGGVIDIASATLPLSMEGSGSYAFLLPSDVAVDGTRIYVSAPGYLRLHAFSYTTGAYLWHKEGVGSPRGIILDGAGNLVAANGDYSRNRIEFYACETGLVGPILGGPSSPGDGELSSPCDVAASPDGGVIYLSDKTYNRVLELSPNGSTLTRRWGGAGGAYGSGPEQFYYPLGLAAAPDGTIYVADSMNHRVQVLDPAAGTFASSWGASAPVSSAETGSFNGPYDVDVAKDGSFAFVADCNNDRLQKFTLAGIYTLSFGSHLDYPTTSYSPFALAIDPGKQSLVAARSDGKIVRLSATDGTVAFPYIFSKTAGITSISAEDVETDSDGNIYAAVQANSVWEIRKYSPAGSLLATLPAPEGGYAWICGLGLVPLGAAQNPGRVYAVDGAMKKVYWFDPQN